MNDEVKKIIGESYKRLPFDLKKAIVSSEVRQQMQSIAEKHWLDADQANDLETETALVILGLRPPADFTTNIKNALNLPEEKARAIAEDINVEIFRPVRESLRKIHGIETPNPAPMPKPLPTLPTPPPLVVPKPPAPPAPPTQIPTPPIPEKPESVPKSDLGEHQVRLDENEDNFSREEILAGIENPAKAPPHITDPYREPLN